MNEQEVRIGDELLSYMSMVSIGYPYTENLL